MLEDNVLLLNSFSFIFCCFGFRRDWTLNCWSCQKTYYYHSYGFPTWLFFSKLSARFLPSSSQSKFFQLCIVQLINHRNTEFGSLKRKVYASRVSKLQVFRNLLDFQSECHWKLSTRYLPLSSESTACYFLESTDSVFWAGVSRMQNILDS